MRARTRAPGEPANGDLGLPNVTVDLEARIVRLIDDRLPGFATRDLVAAAEVVDMLLDLRTAASTAIALSSLVPTILPTDGSVTGV